ncbi:hypothetical protein MACH08_10670 [Oceanobacillus kimchii]|uniref:Uncharacterized protein n=2 Tax=Oceanobacillus TaxID=182709 RepID=A0ABQ5TEM6_9BACI|nr:hypothetical protein [Oceanobacillus sp. ISL-74]GLO65283.1 hypothetical protein MACH08_10670 [Oceanobacillus kimchii]
MQGKKIITLLALILTIFSVVLMMTLYFDWNYLMNITFIRVGNFFILTSLAFSILAFIMAIFSHNKWKLVLQLINFSLVIILAVINIMALGFNDP